MDSKQDVKARNSFNKLCSILIDILVVPVFVVAFVCVIIMSTAKANNKVPSIMGNSIVEVMSDSMDVEGGFKKGDVLIINQTDVKSLKVGDCIAFYAPKQSGFVDSNGNSLVIFHRIVRIIYAIPYKNGVAVSDVPVRHFVCRGDALGTLTFANGGLIPTQACSDGEENPGGDYDEFGSINSNGGYVVKLHDDTYVETNKNQVQNSQSDLQYVTDEFVVGKLKNKASGFISSIIKFCSSEKGIILLVILPSLIMIAIILINLINEAKVAKQERENDQLVLARNFSLMSSLPVSEDVNSNVQATENAENQKTENSVKNTNMVLQNIPKQKENENLSKEQDNIKKSVPVVPEKPQKVDNKKQLQKTESNLVQPKISDKKIITKTDNKSEISIPQKVAETPKKPVTVPKKEVNTVKKAESITKKVKAAPKKVEPAYKKVAEPPKKSLPQKQTKTDSKKEQTKTVGQNVPKKPITKPAINKVPPKK